MNAMIDFAKVVDVINDWIGRILCWLIAVLILQTVYEVITRRVFGSPTIWTLELSTYLFCILTAMTLACTEQYKAHAMVDLLVSFLPPRVRSILAIITFAFGLGLFSTVMVYFSFFYAMDSVSLMERSPSAWNAWIWPTKCFYCLGFFMLLLQGLSDLFKEIYFLKKGERA